MGYKITVALHIQFLHNFKGTYGKHLPLQLFFWTLIQQAAISIKQSILIQGY